MTRDLNRTLLRLALLAGAATLVLPVTARAQGSTPAPARGDAGGAADDLGLDDKGDDDLLRKAVVQSATKGETTIAEAPAVVHVITGEDLTAYGQRNILEALLFIPGFLEVNAQYDIVPMWTVRGVNQAVLYLRDGLSMFDPMFNIVSGMRRIPMENIKRIEAMTAPGGVLWGANSFLGIVNVITKDAEDVNGFEIGIGGGHGKGDQAVVRPYIMFGKTFLKNRLKVFAHWSLEWFGGPEYNLNPQLWMYIPPPGVNSPASYREPAGFPTSQPQSFFSSFDGKISYVVPNKATELMLAWQLSFHRLPKYYDTDAKRYTWWNGLYHPGGFLSEAQTSDSPLSRLRGNRVNWHESYVFLRYKDRWLDNKLGLNVRGYYIQFGREFDPTVIFPYTEQVLAGLAFKTNTTAHRAGTTIDFDYQPTKWLRLLWGGEAFYEWVKDANLEFIAPLDGAGNLDFTKINLTCPYYNRSGTGVPVYDPNNPSNTTYVPGCRQPFAFDTDRLVYAVFASAQFRPHKKLTFDAGLRLQHAPAGNATYDPTILYSAAAVWNIWKEIYLKANWATGFRSPVFNSTSGNGAAVQFAGNPDLKVETSQALQVELNAKLVRNVKAIREWSARINYSYTILDNMVRILNARYVNSDRRAVNAVEFFSGLYLKGGHQLGLSYTFSQIYGEAELDGGMMRSVPNHWFATQLMFKVMEHKGWKLFVNSTLRVIGGFEDPNRALVCASGSSYCNARATDLAFDKQPAVALLNLGARVVGKIANKQVEFSANSYNTFDAQYYAGDYFYDLGPRTELLATQGPRFYFFLQAKLNL
jgi:outer membrane receptor protein involved in Fe transport